jgi:drug/metabolite transporter (DMT)-like permease
VFWFGLTASVVCGGFQLVTSEFHALRWDNLWILVGMGVGGSLAQLTMTRAYRTGNTLVVGALSYSTIVFAALYTLLIWHDPLEPAAWVGIGIIVASGLLAMRVEKKEQVEEAGFDA